MKKLFLLVVLLLSLMLTACPRDSNANAQAVVNAYGNNPIGQAGAWCNVHCPK